MHRYQEIVVYGCSLTKDNYIDTWADQLSNILDCRLVNYAERGAGYTYIMQKVLSSPIPDKDTLSVIMWPSADRFDLYVNSATPHLQNDIEQASWLNGNAPMFVDYNGNYIQDHGWYINGAAPRGYKNMYYKYFYNQTTHVNLAWSTIVAVQQYFKSTGSNYIMCNSYPLQNLIQYHDDGVTDFNHRLYDKIDLTRFVDNADAKGFIGLVKEQRFEFFNPHYPTSSAHQWYINNYILPKITNANSLS